MGERRKLSRLVWVILVPLAILLPGTIIFLVIRWARGSLDKEAFEGLKLIYTIMAILWGAGLAWAGIEAGIRRAKLHDGGGLYQVFVFLQWVATAMLILGALSILFGGIPALLDQEWLMIACVAAGFFIYSFRTIEGKK